VTASVDALGPIWVVVPTYNEAENVGPLVERLLGVFETHALDGHVLVVDDGSPDGTAEIVDELAARDARVALLRRKTKAGIGPAYLAGFRVALEAGSSRILEMDCDFSHDPADVPRLVAASMNADLVLGSRYTPGGGVRRWGAIRRAISRGGCWYARTILRVRVRDLTGGFKCFRREVLETVALDQVSATGYGFQIEMTWRTLLAGFRVVEIPIIFTERIQGESKMRGGIVTEAALLIPRLRRLGRPPVSSSQAP
jgi:dolichol-phosphate mannosyltransferase